MSSAHDIDRSQCADDDFMEGGFFDKPDQLALTRLQWKLDFFYRREFEDEYRGGGR